VINRETYTQIGRARQREKKSEHERLEKTEREQERKIPEHNNILTGGFLKQSTAKLHARLFEFDSNPQFQKSRKSQR